MSMYGLIECSDNYSKPSGRLGKYYRYKQGGSRDAPIIDSKSIKSKVGVTGKVSNNANTKDFKIAVPLKYLSNFWRTLEISLIKIEKLIPF